MRLFRRFRHRDQLDRELKIIAYVTPSDPRCTSDGYCFSPATKTSLWVNYENIKALPKVCKITVNETSNNQTIQHVFLNADDLYNYMDTNNLIPDRLPDDRTPARQRMKIF